MPPKGKSARVEISERTGKPKIVRHQLGKEEAKAAAKMTKEQWMKFRTDKWNEQWPVPEYMAEKREVHFVRDGGEGAYRDRTYEVVTRWMAETNISYRPHAKAPGSKSHVRYEKYARARTVGEALKLGSFPQDWCFDYEHGFIKVEGSVREEPIDISKVDDEKKITEVDKIISSWFRRELAKRYSLKIEDLKMERGNGENVLMRAHRLVANRKAEGYIQAAERAERVITDEEVLSVLSTWAFARNTARQNVMGEGVEWVWSDTMGLLRDRMGDIHLTQATVRYPAVTRIISIWLCGRLPQEVASFRFTSLNLNCNYAAARHRDGNNFGPSMIKAFGDFTGGELNVFPNDDRSTKSLEDLPADDKVKLDVKNNLAMFNGNSAHEVDDFQGTRFSVVYFTLGCHAKAKEEDKARLAELGMPFPAADEDPYALLQRPRGYEGGRPVARPGIKTARAAVMPEKGPLSEGMRLWSVVALEKAGNKCGDCPRAAATKRPGLKAAALKQAMLH